ncbi:MAG: S8 family serine peptidase [Candidatus Limnocylindria bacterium]
MTLRLTSPEMSASRGRLPAALLAALFVLAALVPAVQSGRLAAELVSVIVREAPGSGSLPEQLVEASGGTVTMALPIIDGFAAELPQAAITRIAADPAVVSITPNAPLQLQGGGYDDDRDKKDKDKKDKNKDKKDRDRDDDDDDDDEDEGEREHDRDDPVDIGSMRSTAQITGATEFWRAGFTGWGVDVAIIDSGVSPVLGLSDPGKVVHGPDLSFDSQAPNLQHLDTFGHGTFMAGVIAGHDPGVRVKPGKNATGYLGIAPDARIVSIKVANATGATDVSQVIAAIDWVIQHRYDNGMNIRVLNLSFGTYGSQPYALDPLAFAAEVAWHSGIFVVVAAGNATTESGRLMNPAMDPFLMAVGATGQNGTLRARDDLVLPSSARGDGVRNPDMVAPGRSIQGLRVPGSYIDTTFPGGRISDRFFRGTGTSQAAAVMSGAAALVIQQRPDITPDQLKALLTSTARKLPAADDRGQGFGLLDLEAALKKRTKQSVQGWARATGVGSLELARGGNHLVVDGVLLDGERDIFGAPFDSAAMAAATLAGAAWTGGTWNGSVWTGEGWAGNEWSSVTWSGTSWSGNEWSTYAWSANEWSGSEWSASEWSASEWSASEWSTSDWASAGWQSVDWGSR